MTIEDAKFIIEENRNWNTAQKSYSFICKGILTLEDDVFDARRKALIKAWELLSREGV